jgi:hypothetical protein
VRVCADSELNLSNDAVRLEIQGVLHYCNRGRFKKIELLSILLLHFCFVSIHLRCCIYLCVCIDFGLNGSYECMNNDRRKSIDQEIVSV